MTEPPFEPKDKSGALAHADTMLAKFTDAIDTVIDLCAGHVHTVEMAEVLEARAAQLRQPYQNPEDNEVEAKAQRQ